MAILEVACFTAKSAAIACEAGADRIELCDNCPAGGTTPTRDVILDTVALARSSNIPVFLMIRPRGGDFAYSDEEYARMKEHVRAYRSHVDGFVLGILTVGHAVDTARTKELVRLARPLPCTFHRAFDQAKDLSIALEDIVATGCKAILTSGGAQNATHGIATLSKLAKQAAGRLEIIPGGGVRSQNLRLLRTATGANCFHTSALLQHKAFPSQDEIRRMLSILRGAAEVESPSTVSPSPPSEVDEGDETYQQDVSASAVSIGSSPVRAG